MTHFMTEFEMKNYIRDLIDEYRRKLPEYCQSWEAVAGIAGISRNSIYDILAPRAKVKLDTIVMFALALEMSEEDFLILCGYKGYCLKLFIVRDQLIKRSFAECEYDPDQLNEKLEEHHEKPLLRAV